MDKVPDERFQTMDELAAALEAYENVMGSGPLPTLAPPPRSRADTSESILMLPRQARNTRPVLIVIGTVALLWALALLGGAASSGLNLLLGRGEGETLSNTEAVFLSVALLAVLLTPGILLLRHLRKTTWDNTTKVVKLLDTTRLALLASMAAYGSAAMLVRVLDAVMVRIEPNDLFGRGGGSSWAPWSIVFAAVSALAAFVVVWSRRVMRAGGRDPSRFRQFIAGPGMAVGGLLLGSALLYAGFTWRLQSAVEGRTPVDEGPLPSADVVSQPTAAPTQSLAAAASSAPLASDVEHAPAAELDAAMAKGPIALEALGKLYPDDPAVMRSLVVVYAKKAETYLRALEWSEKLLAQAPGEGSWPVLRQLMLRAAQGADAAAATRAFELMAEKMDFHGPDLLYDLMIASKPTVRDRAKRLLDHEDVRKRSKPALRIAYDLKTAKTCADAVKLLDRAVSDGDQRTVSILSFNVDGSGRGCGPRGRSRCPPRCKEEAAKMRSALEKINVAKR
jgi:hypothetical protein